MRSTLLIVLAAALVLPAAAVGADPAKDAATTGAAPATPFDVTDRNHDGAIDRAEFQDRQVEIFYFLDGNKDGFLVIDEIRDVPSTRFKECDADGDGKLSMPEYLNARSKDYDAADKNADGRLTSQEATGK